MTKFKCQMPNAGFTLVELLVVLSIIGLLTGLVTVNLTAARVKARDNVRTSDMANLASALELYRSEQKLYPPAREFQTIQFIERDLVPRYIGSLPRDPKFQPNAFGKGYVYRTNPLSMKTPDGKTEAKANGSLFVVDAGLEGRDHPDVNTTIEPLNSGSTRFFQSGIYQDGSGVFHFRVSSR